MRRTPRPAPGVTAVLAAFAVLAVLLPAPGAAPAAAQEAPREARGEAAGEGAAGAAECTVRDRNGMITLVICPPGLDAAALQRAGQAACDGRRPCLAWIWDDPEAVPAVAPPTSEELGGEALAAARAVWVEDDRQFISLEQPYIGIGAGEPDWEWAGEWNGDWNGESNGEWGGAPGGAPGGEFGDLPGSDTPLLPPHD